MSKLVGPYAIRMATVLLICAGHVAAAGPELAGTYYRVDEAFPGFAQFWSEGAPAENNPGNPNAQAAPRAIRLGSSLHIFVRNTATQSLAITDVAFEGIGLKRAIAFSDQRKNRTPASIFFSNLPAQDKERLIAAGEPVWWRADPEPLAPGRIGEVTIRLRATPRSDAVHVDLKYPAGSLPVRVAVGEGAPRFEGISFAPDLREVFVYVRHPKAAGGKPAKILFDGVDVTASAKMGADPKVNLVALVIPLPAAMEAGSFHCLQATYPDGTTALAGIRAWYDEFAYGVWGGQPGDESDTAVARAYVRNLHEHNVNMQMPQVGSRALSAFYKSDAGQTFCREQGVRFVIGDLDKWGIRTPYAYFIHDEPDAGDAHITGLPGGHEVGSLAEWAIERSQGWREQYPAVPQTLNVDLTYKPYNYYIYGQLPDILMADPYYQPRLRTAYWNRPDRIGVYKTARFVNAISAVIRSAAAPKPTHIILYANRYIEQKNRKKARGKAKENKPESAAPAENRTFRYPTPEEKRIEVFYALAGGAKGISYWWFTPGRPAYGLGGKGPEAERLWREVGLIGAEVRTAGPLILRSCPADVPTKAPAGAMVRCLLAGMDTIVVIVVNEQHVNDEQKTTITPISDADVVVGLPSWLDGTDVFEVGAKGITQARVSKSNSTVTLKLGTLTLPRMIIVTADTKLRGRMEELYRSKFAGNVAKLLARDNP
jgi:hypothetical protein